jgi:DinB superfamily
MPPPTCCLEFHTAFRTRTIVLSPVGASFASPGRQAWVAKKKPSPAGAKFLAAAHSRHAPEFANGTSNFCARSPLHVRFAAHPDGRAKRKPHHMPTTKKSYPPAILNELLSSLTEDHAHAGFDAAVKKFPSALRGRRPNGVPHSAWQLVDHLRIAQWDIVQYALHAKHKSPKFPDGYWPKSPEPPNANSWDAAIKNFHADRKTLVAALKKSDILAPIPHANNQSLLSKTILLIDHNAYHIAQIIQIRHLLQIWPAK